MLRYHHVITILCTAAIILLIVSIGMPVASGSNQTIEGLPILLIGWMGIAAWQFGWFANLMILWISLKGIADNAITLRSFLILIALAANAASWNEIYDSNGGTTVRVWHLGYYVWWTSIGCVVAASILDFVLRRSYRRWLRTLQFVND